MRSEKSPLATCTLERPFQNKHPSSEKHLSTPCSHLPLPFLSTSPARALCIGIINFFVPHLTGVFHFTSMHLAGGELAITGYISHTALQVFRVSLQHYQPDTNIQFWGKREKKKKIVVFCNADCIKWQLDCETVIMLSSGD